MGGETALVAANGGKIAFSEAGSGPLVVLNPGMGDLRSSYRFQVPVLEREGYRAVSVDLRGHGDSDTTFTTYGDEPTSDDLVVVIEQIEMNVVDSFLGVIQFFRFKLRGRQVVSRILTEIGLARR